MKAYKYRIYPNKQQIELMNKHFGCVRFVYNWGLEQKVKSYQVDSRNVTCFDLVNKLKADLKVQNVWLTEVNSQSLQMALRNLDNAFTKFFKKTAKFPRFKNKHDRQSFQCPQFCTVDFNKHTVNLPKLKGIKAALHRKFTGKIKTVTISKTATNKFFASILVDDGVLFPKTCISTKENSVGVDLGIKDFAVLSTGEKIKNPRHLKKSENKLAKLQKQLSKKKKGSSNRSKARHNVALLYEKITNQRKDFLHKLSKRLIDENQAICLEDLAVQNMLKNKKLAKHISDVSWSIFRSFCTYKAEWYGKDVRIIGRFEPSSKMCNKCGTINRNLTLGDRVWTCICGTTHDRDILAANNILNFAFIRNSDSKSTVGTAGC